MARSKIRRQNRQKSTKHTTFKAVLEVEMLKKCTPLWREAHFEVKMYKTPQRRGSFGRSDVETVQAVVARSTLIFKSKMLKTEGLCSDAVLRGRREGFCTLPKVSKT